ncbi:hypothetical protein HAX54_021434 [Datura stramonium]|uniref:Beta-glucosidase n=1 Tax=Datura stramonium TaxID=4076 RepID=A0ABS8USX9_DATST|nr:hypothetical protein [Datura stramonium]
MIDGFQKGALESRLGVPIFYGTDAIHGNNNVWGATVFPHNIGLGATRDPDLVRRIGSCDSSKPGHVDLNMLLLLVLLLRKILDGEDFTRPPEGHPYGYPYVAGRNYVMASAKHFVGDGATENGTNEGNTIATHDEMFNIHLAPYIDCIAQGVCTVMASYSSWNGDKMHSHRYLLTEVLKDKLGFKGLLISDWEALDRLSDPHGSDYRQSIKSTINAGIDMVMVPFRYELFLEELLSLVESGEIPMTRIDDAVERVLRVKFVAGLFEHPFTDRSLIDLAGCKCGGCTVTWTGLSGRITVGTTIMDALREVLGNKTEIVFEPNPTPETFASQDFSFAIVAIGEGPYCETGGDDPELKIPFNGTEIATFVADRVPTVTILISGRPMVIEPSLLEKVDAFVAACCSGTEGAGITDVLFGDYPFQGKLPVTWFKTVD